MVKIKYENAIGNTAENIAGMEKNEYANYFILDIQVNLFSMSFVMRLWQRNWA